MKAKNAILCRLVDAKFTKVMQCTTTKELWDNLQSIYQGNDKVRKFKLQTLSMQFETIKMKEEEDGASYFMSVDEIVNSITGIGATIK